MDYPFELRKCRECGLVAYTPFQLDKFATDKYLKYGKKNFCKKCHSKDSVARKQEIN